MVMPAFLPCLVFSNNPFSNDIPIVLSRVQKIDITTSEVEVFLYEESDPALFSSSSHGCHQLLDGEVTELKRMGIEEQMFQ